ncbi:MAG: hypothetical protein ACE5FS_03515 [Paracoccaceae bacterium]
MKAALSGRFAVEPAIMAGIRQYAKTVNLCSDAAGVIRSATSKEISEKADALMTAVKERFHPLKIYGEILERIGVDHPFQR